MKKFFLDRVKEPSSYAGLAAVVMGLGQVARVNEAPVVADAIVNVGTAVVAGAGWPGVLMAALGSLAVLLKEKK